MNDLSTKYTGDIAQEYIARRSHSLKWRREHQVLAVMLDDLPKEMSILDVPVGTGRFLPEYSARQYDVVGIDISVDMLAQARLACQRLNSQTQLLIGDAEALQISSAAVDVLVCFRLLNWMEPDCLEKVIKEFTRVIRRWMVLEIRVADRPGLLTLLRRIARPSVMLNAARQVAKSISFYLKKNKLQVGSAFTPIRVHEEKAILALFTKQRLIIHRVVAVDDGQCSLRGIRSPLKVFLLRTC